MMNDFLEFFSNFEFQKIIAFGDCLVKGNIITLLKIYKMNALLTLLLLMTNFICQVINDVVVWLTGLFS